MVTSIGILLFLFAESLNISSDSLVKASNLSSIYIFFDHKCALEVTVVPYLETLVRRNKSFRGQTFVTGKRSSTNGPMDSS